MKGNLPMSVRRIITAKMAKDYRKNDNPKAERKNYTVVRQTVGY